MENPDPRREHRVAFALREALPTRRHAEMLFEMAVDHLGAGARVESDSDGNHRVLFVVEEGDPRRVVPWPVLTLSRNPRQVFHLEIPGLKPAPPPPPRPGKAPNLRGLGPGFLSLHEGARYVQVAYAEDGRWFETSRGGPPETLEGVLPLLAAGGGPPVERVAAFVASLDPAALGPLRILLPDPAARRAGPTGEAGLAALRAALARGAFPPGTRWIAADAVDGTAVAGGPSRDEALFAWAAEVERVRPGSVPPPPPPPPPSFEPPGEPELPPPADPPKRKGKRRLRIRLEFGGGDPMLPAPPPPPPPPPGKVPAAILALPDLPAAPPPAGEWRWTLGSCGRPVAVAFREDAEGWTLLGEGALAALGAAGAEAAMEGANRRLEEEDAEDGEGPPGEGGAAAFTLRLYRLAGEGAGPAPRPAVAATEGRGDAAVPPLDGDRLRLGAARLRRTRG